ncbi:MAG: L-tyrosine/L-tryptophan isonitrile synthase family protein [Cyanobacteria bacterium HKST-UBA04]|nr:L-tyrosine/L-tryptophan isonitrile synthase family protein [Cyanobacteria bacterium HKST-UBA04]MCA9841644.1 L-tyrosine/L-tryptophan isonitrile synthase family protein [Cyanobacteria bacterium HKST-UBA03]
MTAVSVPMRVADPMAPVSVAPAHTALPLLIDTPPARFIEASVPLPDLAPFFDRAMAQLACVQQPSPHIKAPKAATVAERAQLILDKLSATKYCRVRPKVPEQFLKFIGRCIEAGQPIPFILGHGPIKNRNNSPVAHVDWAELLSYIQLSRLANDVKALHEPGITVSLYIDDARSHFANDIPFDVMDAYRQSINRLLAATGLDQLIVEVVSFKQLYDNHAHYFCLDEALVWAEKWRSDPTHAQDWVDLVCHAHRNLVFDADTPDAEKQRKAEDSAFRYLWGHKAEQECGIWDRPDVLYMRYSPHQGFYQIFTMRKGSVSQPWQGQGCLVLTDQGKVDPTLYTVSKRHTHGVVGVVETPLQLGDPASMLRGQFDRLAIITAR